MKRTNEQVNKIIAEFMGARIETVTSWDKKEPYSRLVDHNGSYKGLYTKSLDPCVPVMEKLNFFSLRIEDKAIKDEPNTILAVINCHDKRYTFGSERANWNKTIQEATAHALAEAIEEI